MRTTVSTKEISHFSKDAPDWWNESGKFRPLHALNPVRLDFILGEIESHSEKPVKKLSILDCGCGGGLVCEPLARLGATVTGIDADPVAIEVAKNHAALSGLKIDYRNTTIEDCASSNRRFDVVLALEIIEHVDDVVLFLRSLSKVLKPGGILIISTLNRTSKSFIQGIVIAEDILGWVSPGTHDWNKFICPDEMRNLLTAQKMKIKTTRGIIFRPITRRWILGDDTDVNYILSATRKF